MIRWVLIGGLMLSFLLGCGGTATVSQRPAAVGYSPRQLVVHPLSSTRQLPDGSLTAQIYVQLLDPDGFPMRGRGTIEVDVADGDQGREAVMTRRSWTCDVSSDALNRLHFDPMTRSYVVSLVLNPEQPPTAMDVRARFQLADGRALTAQGTLSAPSPATIYTGPAPAE